MNTEASVNNCSNGKLNKREKLIGKRCASSLEPESCSDCFKLAVWSWKVTRTASRQQFRAEKLVG